jgi:ketosteroid isomerase-like protein
VHQVTRHRHVLYAAAAGYWARMSRENVDVVLRAFDAWNRGDIDAWLALVHADIEWFSEIASEVHGSEAVYQGHAELRRFWDEFHSVWDLTIDVSGHATSATPSSRSVASERAARRAGSTSSGRLPS